MGSLKKSYPMTKELLDIRVTVYTPVTKGQSADISLTRIKIRWHKVLRVRTGYNQHYILSCKFQSAVLAI